MSLRGVDVGGGQRELALANYRKSTGRGGVGGGTCPSPHGPRLPRSLMNEGSLIENPRFVKPSKGRMTSQPPHAHRVRSELRDYATTLQGNHSTFPAS